MKNEADMMHGMDYSDQSVSGWLLSEKLDGCRAFWDGREMWTRGGRQIRIPEQWRALLPPVSLDGEIHAGRGGFEVARCAVQYGRFTPACRFSVFDAPDSHGPFSYRYGYLTALLVPMGPVAYCEHLPCRNAAEANALFHETHRAGGEGLVLRDPDGLYTPGRTAQVLKVKLPIL